MGVMATILMVFLRIDHYFLKIHNLTFKDAQVNFNDTQFV